MTIAYFKDVQYQKSTTPYKDALMKGLMKPKFKNRSCHYYKKLGNKINQIVESQSKERTYRYWWIEEFIRENNIKRDHFLQQKEYVICD